MKIAIIPARGGSKRIPRKNIKDFFGKPVIAYAIDAALASDCFDEVIVSTDDAEIADIAILYGASVPFMRSTENASDTAGTVPVLLEVLGLKPADYTTICCIYPCNPFLTSEKVQEGLIKHLETGADSTFPVVAYSYPPQRALRIANGNAKMLHPQHYPTRSQDLEKIYHDAGQFYWLNVKAVKEQQKLFMAKSTPLIYRETEVQDIDTLEDWTLAEVKYQLWRNNSQSLSLGQAPKAQASITPV